MCLTCRIDIGLIFDEYACRGLFCVRMQVGENATRTVAVKNRSPVPLFYSISKSMSISSGFLKIPEVCVPPSPRPVVHFVTGVSLPSEKGGSSAPNLCSSQCLSTWCFWVVLSTFSRLCVCAFCADLHS